MTEEEAGKKVPPKLTVANMKKLVCSICTRECIPSMLRRHLFSVHSDLTTDEVNTIFEEASRVKDKEPDVVEEELEKNPLFSKVEPDGRIKCKAPDCPHLVSAQNIAR